MAEDSNLVARLRLLDNSCTYYNITKTCSQAADALAEQAETIERLRQQLEAFNAHPPLLVDGKTGKVTPLVDAANLQIEVDRLREALEQLRQSDRLAEESEEPTRGV